MTLQRTCIMTALCSCDSNGGGLGAAAAGWAGGGGCLELRMMVCVSV